MIKRALILTIILNSIILIGFPSGHGYGIMIMVEFMSIPTMIKNGFELQNDYPLESSIILIALISLIGKLISILTLFKKNILSNPKWIYIGLTLMLISFMGVCYRTFDYDHFLFLVTFGSGIPFLLYVGRVLYLLHKENKQADFKTD